jgi:hypothetical protein
VRRSLAPLFGKVPTEKQAVATTRELVKRVDGFVRARDLLVNSEVRRLAGGGKPVQRKTLLAWRERADDPFPAPVRVSGGVEIWDRVEVNRWLRRNGR